CPRQRRAAWWSVGTGHEPVERGKLQERGARSNPRDKRLEAGRSNRAERGAELFIAERGEREEHASGRRGQGRSVGERRQGVDERSTVDNQRGATDLSVVAGFGECAAHRRVIPAIARRQKLLEA